MALNCYFFPWRFRQFIWAIRWTNKLESVQPIPRQWWRWALWSPRNSNSRCLKFDWQLCSHSALWEQIVYIASLWSSWLHFFSKKTEAPVSLASLTPGEGGILQLPKQHKPVWEMEKFVKNSSLWKPTNHKPPFSLLVPEPSSSIESDWNGRVYTSCTCTFYVIQQNIFCCEMSFVQTELAKRWKTAMQPKCFFPLVIVIRGTTLCTKLGIKKYQQNIHLTFNCITVFN